MMDGQEAICLLLVLTSRSVSVGYINLEYQDYNGYIKLWSPN